MAVISVGGVSTGLPRELAEDVSRTAAYFDRGLITREELGQELLGSLARFVVAEFEGVRPDPGVVPGMTEEGWVAWGIDGRKQHQRLASLAVSVASCYAPGVEVVCRVFDGPAWRVVLPMVQDGLVAAAVGGHLEPLAWTAWQAARRGVLPRRAREAVRGVRSDSALVAVDLVESDREGDASRVAQIVAGAGERGCVSAVVELLRVRRAEGRAVEAAAVARLLSADELAERGEFGGIALVAAELLADGEDVWAARWSGRVEDDLLWTRSQCEGAGWKEYGDDRLARRHGPGRCLPMCNERDARLFGALAFIDWVAGDVDRALSRAARCDAGCDVSGWSAAGVELLAGWVLTRRSCPSDRVGQLLLLLHRAELQHVALGLSGVQLHSEIAELSAIAGNAEAAGYHSCRAGLFERSPVMQLHIEPFQFPTLLSRFPRVVALQSRPGVSTRK